MTLDEAEEVFGEVYNMMDKIADYDIVECKINQSPMCYTFVFKCGVVRFNIQKFSDERFVRAHVHVNGKTYAEEWIEEHEKLRQWMYDRLTEGENNGEPETTNN